MSRTNHLRNRFGFTLVELEISIAVIGIILAGLIPIIFTVVNTSQADSIKASLTSDSQLALTQLERDVRYSTQFSQTVSSPFNDSNAPSSGWKIDGTSSSNRVLILKSPSTTNNPYSKNRQQVYIDDPAYNCSTTANTGTLYLNPVLTYTTVYFVTGNTLYRRILTETSTPVCNSAVQYQKQSCPTGSGGACQAKDEVVVENVSNFSITYLQQQDSPTPTFNTMDVYGASPAQPVNDADMITVSLELARSSGSTMITVPLSLNVSRLNK